MASPFYIYDRIIGCLFLKVEMLAECIQVELQLSTGSRIVRYVIEDMNLMIYILDIVERWERDGCYLPQTLGIG